MLNSKNLILTLFLIAALTALVVWFSPHEKTLGAGIKVVYVHVALIWTGMSGVVVAGVLGLIVLATNRESLQRRNNRLLWVSLGFFAAGLAMSLLAAKINWGAVLWSEPRMQASLRFLGIAVIVQIISAWLPWFRLRGLLSFLLAATMLFAILGTPLVLHPESPIRESGSSAIQMTFLGLFVLFMLAAVAVMLLLETSKKTS